MSRRALIILLAGVNLLLLAGVIFTVHSPSTAVAQVVARGTDYIMVSAETETDNDVIYLIDSRARRMYAFRTTYPRMPNTPARFGVLAQRDLTRDFRRDR